MATDPYGFPLDGPVIEAPRGPAAGLLTLGWSLAMVAFALLCSGVALLITVNTTQPRVLDYFGVFLLSSVCAWPAVGILGWSVALHLVARRWWAQAGPNLLLGATTGLFVWMIVFCCTALVAGGTR